MRELFDPIIPVEITSSIAFAILIIGIIGLIIEHIIVKNHEKKIRKEMGI